MNEEEPNPTAEDKAHAQEILDGVAVFADWLETSPRAQALWEEWSKLEGRSNVIALLTERVEGKLRYVVACGSGWHSSGSSPDDAFEELVAAHRVRAEDLGSTRDLVWWADGDTHASEILAEVARAVRAGNTRAEGSEHDRLILAEVARRHSAMGVEGLTPEVLEQVRAADPDAWAHRRAAAMAAQIAKMQPIKEAPATADDGKVFS